MKFMYLLELSDKAEGIYFSLVAEAADPHDAVAAAGRRLIADGSLPDEGDWYAVEVSLLLKRNGVYANHPVGKFNLTRVNGAPHVLARNPRTAKT